ncbi:MAG: multicopper oxidase domain-containing protein [Ahrensia sp.]|nr:multicopper oxidase domain-containing protein [Ahrensia sp.]
MPALLDTTKSGRFGLSTNTGQTDFGGGRTGTTAGYNQSYLGPVLKLRSGSVQASVENRLKMPVSSHWHGILVPGEVDGGPHQAIEPGGQWQPELPIDQPPCTAWYHTHIHGATATGVYAGLAGGIVVSDGRDQARGLPSTYGVDDLFLILQDKRFSADGRMVYSGDMMSRMHGFTGDTMLVNGQVGSVTAVPKSIVRLRLLNASNARIFRLALHDGRPMHLIATDGGYLPAPAAIEELRLSPGERAEVLVDFSTAETAMLVSKPDPNAGMGGMMGRMQNLISRLGSDFEVVAFATDERLEGKISAIPDQLGGAIPDLRKLQVAKQRHFSLDMGMGGGMMGGGMMGGEMAINGKAFAERTINLRANLGTVEKWTVSASMLAHPFHIHGVAFEVLSENGNPPRPENRGWKDTVLVNQELELLVRFNRPAPDTAPFMYHCHILEHEDAGMMGQFVVG